ncbi:MAG: phosphatidylglycerophosphatase A [Leptospiraceae bacterium]|nr:phosphatidylglycerophosphatase A [Leptospiraceae bacterium]
MRFLRELTATGFYTGYFPVAPGTAGSWAALCLLIFTVRITGVSWVVAGCLAAVLFSILTLISSGGFAEEIGQEDPGCVVMDEFAGIAVTLAFSSGTLYSLALAFLFFRFFDVVKPWPANRLQDLPGAKGILLDDLVAGLYGGILLLLLQFFFPILNT